MKKTVIQVLALLSLLAAAAGPACAQNLNIGSTPLYLGASVQPIVMLNLPRDHQLYIKAYNDYTDLDNDGIADTQYKHSVIYYGYFDSYKCYDYDTTNHRYVPTNPQRVLTASDRYCSNAGVQATNWSGNFLNWVSMSRMDVVRKMLYGGLRVVDNNTETVVERAIIPGDVHAWAKYYNGGGAANDIKQLTPFNLTSTPGTYPFASTARTVTSITTTTPSVSITSITHSPTTSTTATLVTAAHGLNVVAGVPATTITIAGSSVAAWNGTWTVSAASGTSITLSQPSLNNILLSNGPGGSKTFTSAALPATATVNSAGHGFLAGQVVTIAGVTGPNVAAANLYNGVFTVLAAPAPTGSAFSYAMTGTPSGTATAPNFTATQGFPVRAVSSITFAGTTATVTTLGAHGLTNGTSILMSGARPEIYNGAYVITTTGPSSSTFTYTVASTPTSTCPSTTCTGSITITNATINLTNSGLNRNILVGDQIQLSAGIATPPTTVITPDTVPVGGVTVTGRATAVSATQITLTVDGSSGGCSGNTAPCVNGVPPTYTVTNLSSHGITICNLTMSAAGSTESMTYNNNANPPLMRVVAGNYALWATTDGAQCRWAGLAAPEGGGGNGNKAFYSEIAANQNSPTQATEGRGTGLAGPTAATSTGQFAVRVKVCDSALLGQEKCLQYYNGNWKPVGLLQDYSSGTNRKIRFGLFTGSYSKNFSGGVLRKNASFLDTADAPAAAAAADELDQNTGVFRNVDGILKTLNNLKMYGYTFGSGNYSSGADGCGTPGMVRAGSPLAGTTFPEGNCTSWGNPLAETYSETLRYLAGKSVNTAFTPTPPAAGAYGTGGLAKDATLLLNVQGWQDPLTAATYCAPLNVVVFNASVNSYDRDQVQTELQTAGTGFGINTKALTGTVGTLEGILGASPWSSFMIGDKGNSVVAPTGDGGTCTPKLFDQTNRLGDVFGICPEAPALEGSYLIAGASHWAHTNKIRTDLTVPAADTRSLKVTNYAISLSGANPTIKIPVPGSSPTRYITILPAGRTLNAGSYRGTGSITEFKIVRQNLAAGTGKFFVSWEDSLQGNDYDLDQWGYISYRFLPGNTQIEVTTQVVYASAGFSLGFGFVIGGTQGQDGVHYLSAHLGNTAFNFTAADGTVECTNCQESDLARARTFNVAPAATTGTLQEPLYYAAKYGGFTDQNNNSVPDQTQEWDTRLMDGTDGTDGFPDNYFLVTNPAALETAMDRAFIYILQVSSASSVATNSTSLNTGSRVYQARFNSNEWSGQLLSFGIDINGVIDTQPQWDAGQVMPAANSRVIVTYNPGATPGTAAATKGIPFRWTSLTNAAQITALNTDGGNAAVVDTAGTLCTADSVPVGCTVRGQIRLNYLRGDQSNEGATSTRFRVRPTSVLADIVNSTPRYVGPPSASYTDSSYITFKSTYSGRTPMIFVGSNGGMLHAFEGTTGGSAGIERLAYVPNLMYPFLTKLTSKSYSHRYYVDGSPSINDACFSPCATSTDWKTVAVGGYNSGGQGYYALDVTDPTAWTEANAANIVLWEFTHVNDPDLGYSYSKPIIAKMNNGRWAAIFGNGYNNSIAVTGETACTSGVGTVISPYLPAGCSVSRTGQAYLYILFLDGATDGAWTQGTDYIKIQATAATATVASPNGLASPTASDANGDGQVDYVYAGDLLGNMWKFDLTSASTAAWAVASGGLPLFTATGYSSLAPPAPNPGPQHITTAPVLYTHTSGGTMVLFGTGKYLEGNDDAGPYTRQYSFYGIWDRLDNTTVAKSDLMQQKVLNVTAGNPTGGFTAGTNTVRLTSAYVPNYSSGIRTNAAGTFGNADTNPNYVDSVASTPANMRGWYIDMPNSGDGSPPNAPVLGTGERIAFDPIISTGKLVFTTLIPSVVPCDSGGTSFIMDLDPITGSRLTVSPFDINGDTNFTTTDFVTYAGQSFAVTGLASTIGIVPTPTVIAATGKEFKVLSGSSGGLASVAENCITCLPPTASRTGRRITWREVLSD